MKRRAIAATLALAAPALSGCVAAAVPAVAGAAIVREGAFPDRGDPLPKPPAMPAQAQAQAQASARPAPPAVPALPPSVQYLYGSGEAAALSLQAYQALSSYLIARSSDLAVGHDVQSVVLAPGATLADPKFTDCRGKPLAVVLDVDETVLLNLGYESDAVKRGMAYDDARWRRWEQTGAGRVEAVPGAVDAVTVARRANIAVIYNSNRSSENAAHTAATLNAAGLGPAVPGETLFLRDDAGGGSGKDARRWAIARKYCVVALVGDQLGDFSDLFNADGLGPAERRRLAVSRNVEALWGLGWFILPNPVYGSALAGSHDEVFPRDKQWTDPAGGQ